MPAAARQGDAHSCPQQKHTAKSILQGASTVLINGKLAARLGDACQCLNGPDNQITTGSKKVFINGKAAVRIDDKTAHGGKVTAGSENVFIG